MDIEGGSRSGAAEDEAALHYSAASGIQNEEIPGNLASSG
jgi:hypothetical protein